MARKRLAALVVCAALGVLGVIGGAQAAPCTVNSGFTNPDPWLSDSTNCGEGIGNNDSQADVRTATGDNTWTLVGSVGAPLYLTFNGTTGGKWFIDDSAPDGLDFLVVIKDGATDSTFKWFWFDVDTSVACADTAYDFCGDWSMFGTGGQIKNISHMSLYSQDGRDPPPLDIPEPATLALLGAALIGVGFSRRR